jgi:ribosome-binding factor A
MRFHRSQRVGSLIQEELSKLFLEELEFEGAVVTILEVAVSSKLEEAKVKLAVYPSNKKADVLFALTKKRRELQFILMRKINIKPMPRLIFELEKDHNIDVAP